MKHGFIKIATASPNVTVANCQANLNDAIRIYKNAQASDVKLLVFPGEGTYVHYQDNGEDFEYQNGVYNLYEFTNDGNGNVSQKLMHEGYTTYKEIQHSFIGR